MRSHAVWLLLGAAALCLLSNAALTRAQQPDPVLIDEDDFTPGDSGGGSDGGGSDGGEGPIVITPNPDGGEDGGNDDVTSTDPGWVDGYPGGPVDDDTTDDLVPIYDKEPTNQPTDGGEEEGGERPPVISPNPNKPKPKPKPCFCTKEYAPVCGANGKLYGNSCEARCAKQKKKFGCGMSKVAQCTRDCKLASCRCPKPGRRSVLVCARNGKLYGSVCEMKCLGQKKRFDCGKRSRSKCAKACRRMAA